MRSFQPHLWLPACACWLCSVLRVSAPLALPALLHPWAVQGLSHCVATLCCFSHSGSVNSFSLFSSHEKDLHNYTLETFLELRVNTRKAVFYSLLILSRTYLVLGTQHGTFQFMTFFTYHCLLQKQAVSWCLCLGHLLPGAFTYQGHTSGIPPIKLQLSASF